MPPSLPPTSELSGLVRVPMAPREHTTGSGDGRSNWLSTYKRGAAFAVALLVLSVVGLATTVYWGRSGGLTGREVYTQPFVGDHSRPKIDHAPPRIVDSPGEEGGARWVALCASERVRATVDHL